MKGTKVRVTYEAPHPGGKLFAINLERRYLEQLDEWVKKISERELTSREVAYDRRSILQAFIGSELTGNAPKGMWPEIRRGQALSAAARQIEKLTRRVADLEDVNAALRIGAGEGQVVSLEWHGEAHKKRLIKAAKKGMRQNPQRGREPREGESSGMGV